jgi:hypothetical protein
VLMDDRCTMPYFEDAALFHSTLRPAPPPEETVKVQVQVQVCFTSVDGQVQPLDAA